jgi:hypothetical protein
MVADNHERSGAIRILDPDRVPLPVRHTAPSHPYRDEWKVCYKVA